MCLKTTNSFCCQHHVLDQFLVPNWPYRPPCQGRFLILSANATTPPSWSQCLKPTKMMTKKVNIIFPSHKNSSALLLPSLTCQKEESSQNPPQLLWIACSQEKMTTCLLPAQMDSSLGLSFWNESTSVTASSTQRDDDTKWSQYIAHKMNYKSKGKTIIEWVSPCNPHHVIQTFHCICIWMVSSFLTRKKNKNWAYAVMIK